MEKLTDDQINLLDRFLDFIRDYQHESCNNVGFDDKPNMYFVRSYQKSLSGNPEQTILDASGLKVVKDKTYNIANSNSRIKNKFLCLIDNPRPNDFAFMREGDNRLHYAREFIEYKNGEPYYNISEC